jgi:hypothetical protein
LAITAATALEPSGLSAKRSTPLVVDPGVAVFPEEIVVIRQKEPFVFAAACWANVSLIARGFVLEHLPGPQSRYTSKGYI